MAKATAERTAESRQAYITLTVIENNAGTMRWEAGSQINLTDAQAIRLLEKSLVEPMEGTTPPELPKPKVSVVQPGQNADLDSDEVTEVKDN